MSGLFMFLQTSGLGLLKTLVEMYLLWKQLVISLFLRET